MTLLWLKDWAVNHGTVRSHVDPTMDRTKDTMVYGATVLRSQILEDQI